MSDRQEKIKNISLEAVYRMDLPGSRWMAIRARLTSGDNTAIIQKFYDMSLD